LEAAREVGLEVGIRYSRALSLGKRGRSRSFRDRFGEVRDADGRRAGACAAALGLGPGGFGPCL